jgi:hypothetical protein
MVEKKEKGKASSSTIKSPEGAGIADVVGYKVKKEALGPGQSTGLGLYVIARFEGLGRDNGSETAKYGMESR